MVLSADPCRRGGYIVFDGGEGGGKSLQTRLITARLQEQGIPTIAVREPGGTNAGESLRAILLSPGLSLCTRSQFLILSAARSELIHQVIKPALESGQWVISDRSFVSSIVYQGYAQGESRRKIREISRYAMHGVAPDLILIFDLPVEIGYHRRHARGEMADRFESKSLAFHRKVRAGFLAEARRAHYPIIDASQTVTEVTEAIWEHIVPVLEKITSSSDQGSPHERASHLAT